MGMVQLNLYTLSAMELSVVLEEKMGKQQIVTQGHNIWDGQEPIE